MQSIGITNEYSERTYLWRNSVYFSCAWCFNYRTAVPNRFNSAILKMIKIQGSKELRIPNSFGSNNVTYGGYQIPCASIWDLIGSHMARGTVVPTEDILQAAEDAETFRLERTGMLVHTMAPRKTDYAIKGNVYWRQEKQRVRPLVNMFGIVISKIESELSPTVVNELHEVCGHKKLYPVGMVDDKIYYAPDPEKVFQAFGSRDWVRIGVFLKRPGSSSVDISFV